MRSSKLVTLDGIPVVMIFRFLRGGKYSRQPGVELTKSIVMSRVPHVIVGGKYENIKNAAKLLNHVDYDLRENHFGGFISFPLSQSLLIDVFRTLESNDVKVCLLALGIPKQELFFKEIHGKCKPKYFIGIGGSFDILSGEFTRAPQLLRKLGLEWFWRVMLDPKRLLKRYILDGLFLLELIPIMFFFRMRKYGLNYV